MKNLSIFFAICIVTLSLFPSTLQAQWDQPIPPYQYRGDVSSFAILGSNMFLGTLNDGVFRTTDNGSNWVKTNNGLTNHRVNALITKDSSLFAGTSNGVFLSTDSGSNWTAVNTGLPDTTVNAFTICGSKLYVATSNGLFHSTNDGLNWIQDIGITASSLSASGSNILAGSYHSNDSGANWIQVYDRLSSGSGPFNGSAIIDSTIFANVVFCGSCEIYYTTDNGSNWIGNWSTSSGISVVTTDSSNLYVGTSEDEWGNQVSIVMSTDKGTSWTTISNGIKCTSIRHITAKGATILAETEVGVFLSTNAGSSWILVNNGLMVPTLWSSYNVQAMARNDSIMFAGTTLSGIIVSTNNGSSWSNASDEFSGFPNTVVSALMINDSTVFAGTSNGIYRSTDNGSSWIALNTGLTQNQKIVFSLIVKGSYIFAGTYGGILVSSNNGSSWTPVMQYPTLSLLTTNGNVFAGTGGTGSPGVLYSSNNGSSWKSANTGLTNIVLSFAVIPNSNGTGNTNIFAACADGVYLSTNNGSEWKKASTGLTGTVNTVFAVNTSTLVAGTNSGIYFSKSNGSSWTPLDTGLVDMISAITMSNTDLFAGNYNGVWRIPLSAIPHPLLSILSSSISFGNVKVGLYKDTIITITNNGTDTLKISNMVSSRSTFTARPTIINIGPGQSFTDTLRFMPSVVGADSALITIQSNTNSSPDTIRVSGIANSATKVNHGTELPKCYALDQNYPNPFNPTTTISFNIPSKSFVTLKVYNILGQEIAMVVSEEMQAGSYTKQWNAANMSSGIYFYRLQAGTFTQTKKLVLLR